MWDLKATEMKMQCSLIQELMLYDFKLDHNFVEATKNISCTKDEGEVDHGAVVKWLVYWVLWHINLCRLFNAKFIFM